MKNKILLFVVVLIMLAVMTPAPKAGAYYFPNTPYLHSLTSNEITVWVDYPGPHYWQFLGRVKVKVPSATVACTWTTQYWDIQNYGGNGAETVYYIAIPPYPLQGHFQAVNQGLYIVGWGYTVDDYGPHYMIPSMQQNSPSCLPDPQGANCGCTNWSFD